jgi:hypothetical protein
MFLSNLDYCEVLAFRFDDSEKADCKIESTFNCADNLSNLMYVA